MYLLDENFNPLITPITGRAYSEVLYWEYQTQKKTYKDQDGNKHTRPPHFSLVKNDRWIQIESEAYELSIGKYRIILPVNHYLLIGDFDKGLDFLKSDEIMNRDFEAFTFTNTMEEDSWSLQDLKVVRHIKANKVIMPSTKKPVAVSLDAHRAVMVSSVDNYSKLSDLSFSDII